MNSKPTYFDIERDKVYSYFCEACLTGKKKSQMSKVDMRCCSQCQPFIEADSKLRRGKYSPTAELTDAHHKPSDVNLSSNSVPSMERYSEKGKTKMSTLNPPSVKVDNFRPRGRPKTYRKLQLPDDKIKQLYQEGLGAKAIASQLERERGIDVSYKTIQRVLSGERR